MTFSPGDIVEIVAARSGAPERALGFVGLRARVTPGRTDTDRTYLTLIDCTYRPDGFDGGQPFFWATEHLRLFEAAPREETAVPVATTTRVAGFAVGDRVRVRAGERFCSFSAGALGTITQVDPIGRPYRGPSVGIEMDGATTGGHYGGGEYIAYEREDMGSRATVFELVSSPAPPPAPGFTQKTGPIEVRDVVTLKSTDDYPGNASVPSSLRGVELTVTAKEGRLLTLERPDGRTRRGWVEGRFEHVQVPVDATAAPEPEPTPEPAPATPTTRFVVGDRVRLTEEIGGDAEVGDLGTVEAVLEDGGAYDVRFDGRVMGARGGGVHYSSEDALEAAPAATPEPMPEPVAPVVGGRVRFLTGYVQGATAEVGSEFRITSVSDSQSRPGAWVIETTNRHHSGASRWAFNVPRDGLEILPPADAAPEPTPEPTPEPAPTFQVGDKIVFKDVPENAIVLRDPSRRGVCTVTASPSAGRSPAMIDVEYADGSAGNGWLAYRFELAPSETAEAEPTPELPEAHVFAVGDRVRILAAAYAAEYVGSQGVINRLVDGNEIGGTDHPYVVELQTGNTLYASRVALIEAAPAAEPTPDLDRPLQVGDKVVLRDDYGDNLDLHANPAWPQIGGVYTIAAVNGGFVDLEEKGYGGWLNQRFRFATADDAPLPAPADAPPPPSRPIQDGDRVVLKSVDEHPANAMVPDDLMTLGTVYTVENFTTIGGTATVALHDVRGRHYANRFKLAPAAEATPEPTPEPTPPAPVPGPTPAHVRDMELIGALLAEHAKQGEDDGGWCSAYDRIVETLNRELTVKIPGRNPA